MQGYVRKRGKNSWEVAVSASYDPATGKRRRIYRSVQGSKRDAEALLAQLVYQVGQGIGSAPSRLTVSQYLSHWLSTYASRNTAPRTKARYELLIRLHLAPMIGGVRLSRLQPLQIQGAYTRALERGLSGRTVLQAHRVLHEALRHAVRWQLLASSPAEAVVPPRPSRFEAPTLDLGEIRRLLDAADETSHADLVYTALMTGLRLGELLGLRWRDVDLDAGALFVHQTCQWLPRQGFIFREPKTHRSRRPVAVSEAAGERLRRHRVKQVEARLAIGLAYEDHDLVFADGLGRPLAPWTVRHAWQVIIRAAGLPGVRIHDLRHAHASLLLREGVHPKIVSERLGHSSVSITLDIYSHAAPSLQVQAAAKLDRLIGR